MIEAHFSLQTKISELFDFLRAQHMDKNIPLNSFHLRVPPSKSLTHEMDSNMVEAGLLPAASLFVCGQDARNFKSAEFLDLAVLARVEEPMMVENLNFIEKEEAKSDPSSPKPKPKKKFNPKSLIKL